jgi:hypothetical protein
MEPMLEETSQMRIWGLQERNWSSHPSLAADEGPRLCAAYTAGIQQSGQGLSQTSWNHILVEGIGFAQYVVMVTVCSSSTRSGDGTKPIIWVRLVPCPPVYLWTMKTSKEPMGIGAKDLLGGAQILSHGSLWFCWSWTATFFCCCIFQMTHWKTGSGNMSALSKQGNEMIFWAGLYRHIRRVESIPPLMDTCKWDGSIPSSLLILSRLSLFHTKEGSLLHEVTFKSFQRRRDLINSNGDMLFQVNII